MLDQKQCCSDVWKLMQAAALLIVGLGCSCLALALVHDRQPSSQPFFDLTFHYLDQLDDGMKWAEILTRIVTYSTLALVVAHLHRLVILKRVFLIAGLFYFCRGITVFVTILPQADLQLQCSPQVKERSVHLVAERVWELLTGKSISLERNMSYCGDFIFSGHTSWLVLCCMTFAEYSPRKSVAIRSLCWGLRLISLAAVALIVLSRTHYTVDVILAYFFTSTIFRVYHTAASYGDLRINDPGNQLSRAWWYRLICYFEAGAADGGIPPAFILSNFRKYSGYLERSA